jgi:hypothetical protein
MSRVLVALVLAGCTGASTQPAGKPPAALTAEEEATVSAFVEFARTPSEAAWQAVPKRASVRLALGRRVLVHRPAEELARPSAWNLVPPGRYHLYREGVGIFGGPFSALRAIRFTERISTARGAQRRCAGPPLARPRGITRFRRVAITPVLRPDDSCGMWWSVDLYVDRSGRIGAVALDIGDV